MSQLAIYVNDRGKCVMHYGGFSFMAGIALVVWALQRRLYAVAGISLVYGVAYNTLMLQLSPYVQVFMWLAQFLVIGFLANRFHRWHLERGSWVRTEEELVSARKPGS